MRTIIIKITLIVIMNNINNQSVQQNSDEIGKKEIINIL